MEEKKGGEGGGSRNMPMKINASNFFWAKWLIDSRKKCSKVLAAKAKSIAPSNGRPF